MCPTRSSSRCREHSNAPTPTRAVRRPSTTRSASTRCHPSTVRPKPPRQSRRPSKTISVSGRPLRRMANGRRASASASPKDRNRRTHGICRRRRPSPLPRRVWPPVRDRS
ncbi:hypothetical protein, partial [Mesorhizobium sp.]|uniref:hypothetical protein n=1 Tax=Mesorhizobium sp. TaxID=1871066 RepID=UPI00345C58BE